MFKKELTGIDQIRKYLNLENDLTIVDWKIGYALPVFKEGGVWKAKISDLKKWQLQHKFLKEVQTEPRGKILVLNVRKERFGFLKYEWKRR